MSSTLTRTIALWALLLLAVQGVVMPASGQPANHGAVLTDVSRSMALAPQHSHSHHNLAPEQGDSASLHADANNHTHEKADRIVSAPLLPAVSLFSTLRAQPPEGLPIRRAFRLERPPRHAVS